MDGRRFRRWWVCGGLVLAAVGCNRNTYPENFGFPKPGQTVGAIAPNGGALASKPVWGGGQPPMPSTGPNGMPVEMATTAPKKSSKGLLPETEASLAETHLAAALTDPPPANRDELIDMARIRYQRALKTDPKNKTALLGMARLYAKLGDKERATDAYKTYLKYYPKDAEVMHEIAIVHGQWKDWNGAAAWCETALKVDPENRSFRKTMGFFQARAGKWDDAFATLCKVMPEPQVRYNLAGMLDHLNCPDACRMQLQLALQVDPNFTPAREFLAELDQAVQPGRPVMPGNPDPNAVRQVEYQQR
jgi:Tfp pilus assembly protein PilF